MNVPRHIAIIMDGNGRWAKKHLLPHSEGHRKGAEALRSLVDNAITLGIDYVTLYAFSVDNWKRSAKEVKSLMNLLRRFLKKHIKEVKDKEVGLTVIGRLAGLPPDIVVSIQEATEETQQNKKLTLILALNYGARSEIVDGVKKIYKDIATEKISIDDVDEKSFENYLYTKDIPDPDLLIRTSNEMRLSNFLLWQISYTELWFSPVLWPDFGMKHLQQAISDFNKRERRYGARVRSR